MKISDIKVPYIFLNSPPNSHKIKKCKDYYYKYGKLDKPITINKNGILIDGYVRYVVAKELGLKECPVCKQEIRIYVKGRHSVPGKMYWWMVKKQDEEMFINKVNIGDSIYVNTKKGICPVVVTSIKTRINPPIQKKIKTVVKF